MRSPAHPGAPAESFRDMAARWVREGLDNAKSKPDGWAASMLVALDLSAKSYVHRWLIGEQQVPLQAIAASATSHPEVTEHVARELAALVGMELRRAEHEDAHPRSLADVIVELGDVSRAAAEAERDGARDTVDIDRELAEWDDVERVRSSRVAYLRRLKAECAGGAVVAIGNGKR